MYVFVYDTSIYIVYEVEEERAVVMFVDKFLLLRPQSTHFDCIYIDDIYIYMLRLLAVVDYLLTTAAVVLFYTKL